METNYASHCLENIVDSKYDVVNSFKKLDKEKNSIPISLDSNPKPISLNYILSFTKRFQSGLLRCPITGANFMWAFPYLFKHSNGWRVLGHYTPSTNTSQADSLHDEFIHTYLHEAGHVKGGNEYGAELFASKYKLAA